MSQPQRQYKSVETTTRTFDKNEVPEMPVCEAEDQRLCMDGTCVTRMDLCPEEEMMSQDTILIMIGVGMAVVLFLIVLYCLQQRRNTSENPPQSHDLEDVENPELLIPPPSYEEALNVRLYPPTPQMQRTRQLPSAEEPITPPPNYDAALHILAQSHESVLPERAKNRVTSPLVRRTVSVENVNNNQRRTSGSALPSGAWADGGALLDSQA